MGERRVVHVVRSDSFAGVERYVTDTANELARRGWGVTVIGGNRRLMRSALAPEVGFTPARSTAEVAAAIWDAGPTPLLHTHMTAAEATAMPLKGIRFDRWVTTRHFARPRGSSRLGRAASPLIRARVDVQIAISRYVASSIDGASVVVYNGVPSSTLPPVARERAVVMLQRLEPEKDTASGLRAWQLSGLADDGWRLRVFGRGSQRDNLLALATELGVAASVTFEGFAPEPRRVLAAAGMLLATAPAEPFGLSVVEAMAEGTPVVAADGGAHRETVGDAGVSYQPGSCEAAAAALRRVADDDTLRRDIGVELCRRHGALFSMERHVTELERIYSS